MKVGFVLVIVLLAGCQEPGAGTTTQRPLYNFDSLLTAQAGQVRHLVKVARVNEVTDSVALDMSASQWKRELDVFQKLQSVNRPVYRDRYVMSEYEDPRSNLTVREYRDDHAPVAILRLFYLDRPGRIQKIEAIHREKSFFFSAERQFQLQFESPGSPRLAAFSQKGGQKVFWGDTTLFEIQVRLQ